MNELQITLLVLAAIFIAGFYFMGQRRRRAAGERPDDRSAPHAAPSADASDAPAPQAEDARQQDLFAPRTEDDGIREENGRLVLDLDDVEMVSAETVIATTNFGRPSEPEPEPEKRDAAREPSLFAIMILGKHHYDARTLRHALMAQGLVYDEKNQIFVRRDEGGRTYLRVANAMEPGLLPADDEADFSTPGVALILELPTCIAAPAAMDDMIRLARRLSQRLNANLYKMDRQPMSESDIRAMRSASLDYVSEPLK